MVFLFRDYVASLTCEVINLFADRNLTFLKGMQYRSAITAIIESIYV